MKDTVYIIMGVSGCGKSTIGILLANTLQIPFFDGDDFHPNANIQKMAIGIPLNDEDRKGWLQILNELAFEHTKKGAVIACSALKEKYREQLSANNNGMTFVYLEGTFEEIHERLRKRNNHYMPTTLLKSQFETLEPPMDAIKLSITLTPEEIVSQLVNQIKKP